MYKKRLAGERPVFLCKMTHKQVVPELLTAHELDALSRKTFTSTRLTLIR